ncbi:putative amino acid permease C3H1.09c [Wickerhamomyces ciferrii]|uniref:Amino acid permease C3H1.09c n=1 Tax=Wickerhamomyces ciferrii (strain ATCC 14091 / BCRC 22168 / CBS 111 / JCM 3599 / NBRC 0793 / NRRL Y-1031 F-60-10) TaxID=1206466 RepID=K0KD75_WICCF|nr:putative amino acid permease C3H1.09c [Wickerhamomyces ciferrii]CCH40846.1 putative amino acid permease C3H1.09c [Wickerhamomyces ciferrii]
MVSPSDNHLKPVKISGSLSASLKKNGDHENEDSFKIGDFSSKHFTRKSSVFTNPDQQEGDPSTSITNKIEGGFEDKHTETDIASSYKSARSQNRSSSSALANMISSSYKNNNSILDQYNDDQRPVSSRQHRNSNQFSNPSSLDTKANFLKNGLPQHQSNNSNSNPPPEIDVQNPDPTTIDIVGRHLVNDTDAASSIHTRETTHNAPSLSKNGSTENFDSLQLQGGDISRELYNWQREHTNNDPRLRRRSQSFSGSVHGSITEPDFNVSDIRIPGGFRRNFLVTKASRQGLNSNGHQRNAPTFITSNFIEFLTLYGHFAGEELRDEEDDDDEGDGDEFESDTEGHDEESLLIPARRPRRKNEPHKASTTKAVLLLLKAFIGTGVLFLPRGYKNGGWAFASTSLAFFSILSFWCFNQLIEVKKKLNIPSYGDIGGKLYGKHMRASILFSIVASQIGFAAAYIIFTATNLQAFFISVADKHFSMEFYILIQLLVFIPLSLTRKINKLSGTALIADVFIFLGLIYVYYYCSFVVIHEGIADVQLFNSDSWTVFVGTAIFTYEGIGLLIPIQESMQKPSRFPTILFFVMFTATVVFITIGAIGYFAFGTKTETVILLNFPSDSIFVSISQFLYATAILLSTPLQLFPAIRILENGLFEKSGKFDDKIKWRKNYFRILVVLGTALISWAGASDLDRFVSIIGCFACIPLIYIYPPLLHLPTTGDNHFRKGLDILVTIFGVVIMIYISFLTISDWV